MLFKSIFYLEESSLIESVPESCIRRRVVQYDLLVINLPVFLDLTSVLIINI